MARFLEVTAESDNLFLQLNAYKASRDPLTRKPSDQDVILNAITALVKLLEKKSRPIENGRRLL